MRIKFTEQAAEALMPLGFVGDVKAALEHLGPILLQRADIDTRRTYTEIHGKKIELQIHTPGFEDMRVWCVIDLCPPKEE